MIINKDLDRKKAIVTGATGVIGSAIVSFLNEHGVYCILHYNKNKEKAMEIINSLKNKNMAELVHANLLSNESINQMVNTVKSKHNSIDFLINNAGITRDTLLLEMEDSFFTDVLQVNLFAPYFLLRELSKLIINNGKGKIINISSVSSQRGGAGQSNYSASKAALEALTRIAAIELGRFHITVNSIAPGLTKSDMAFDIINKNEKNLLKKIPLKRIGEAEDVAKAVLFLLSSLSDYITGQCIIVDGGYSLTLK